MSLVQVYFAVAVLVGGVPKAVHQEPVADLNACLIRILEEFADEADPATAKGLPPGITRQASCIMVRKPSDPT